MKRIGNPTKKSFFKKTALPKATGVKKAPVKKVLFPLDRPFLVTVCVLLTFGLLMIMSAGVSYGQVRFDDSYYFFKQQILGLLVGGVVLYIASQIDYHFWQRFAVPIFAVALVLLIMVFIPGIGVNVYGATRWIELGPITFQPAEIMKLSIILYLATWLSQKGEKKVADFNEGLVPFLGILLLIGFLIIKQPDTGTLGVICLMAMAIFFAAGAHIKHLFSLIGLGFASLGVLILLAPYRLARLTVFLNPDHDPSGAGYQVSQALLAVGTGGIIGSGLGQSRQKFNYLPEPVTDSIFAVIAEEFGFIGSALLVALFLYLAWRGLRIAQGAPDMFGRLLVVGVVSWILFQSFINMSAIIGLIPLTGIPLPLISYGGTSLAVILAGLGIVLNISKQSHIQKL
jgi:cell division protein FtsW